MLKDPVAPIQNHLERAKLVYDHQKIIAMVGVRNAYVAYDNYKKALLIEEENLLLAKEKCEHRPGRVSVVASIPLSNCAPPAKPCRCFTAA